MSNPAKPDGSAPPSAGTLARGLCVWTLFYTLLLILIAAAFRFGASDMINFEYKAF